MLDLKKRILRNKAFKILRRRRKKKKFNKKLTKKYFEFKRTVTCPRYIKRNAEFKSNIQKIKKGRFVIDGQTYDNKLTAPPVFSLLKNPEAVITFINMLNSNLKNRKSTFVDLFNVKFIEHDAIVLLLALMVLFKNKNIKFEGSKPNDKECRIKLQESGFFHYLYKGHSFPFNKSADNFIRESGKLTEGEKAQEVIDFATERIWKQRKLSKGVYKILMELMQNTHSHASTDEEGKHHWWLNVNYMNDKACFSFFDYGVGIFTSLKNKKNGSKFYNALDNLQKIFKSENNAENLKLILEGKLHKTSTNKSYRGKGLPGMKDTLDRNLISNLHVITNDSYANVVNNEYRTLKCSLKGTFLYWELTINNIVHDEKIKSN